MKRETLKKYIDDIIIEHCDLNKNYFTSKSDDGENIILHRELLCDALDWYEVLSAIENKCKILINDELIMRQDMTYGEFIDVFYNEIKRERQ